MGSEYQDGSRSREPLVLYSLSEGVATITLNRPEKLNPLSHGPGSMQRAIVDLLAEADADDRVGSVVVTGSGRAFSAGGDVRASKAPETGLDWYWFLSVEDDDNEKIRHFRKPVIGAINGLCFGAAMIMVAHFDMLIASSDARFGLIETRFGGTGAEALNYLVGPQWAKFMALTGELLTATKAKEIGLVLEVVPPEMLTAKGQDLGRRIAAMPRDTMIMNRRMINVGMNASGWIAQKQAGLAFNAATNSCAAQHRAWNGEKFSDLMKQGWQNYKEVRDAPFRTSWFDDPNQGAMKTSSAIHDTPTADAQKHAMNKNFPALVIEDIDGNAVTTLKQIALDELPDRDVLVEVAFSSLNYKDGLVLCGNRNKVARKLPMVGGIDLAGTVVESRSPQCRAGDKVIVNGWGLSENHWGGFSRYQRVDPTWIVPLPTDFTLEQAMAIGTAGYTAALCVDALERWDSISQDRGEVLVTGAAGGVGSIAIALLATRGYKVTASTGRRSTHDYLRKLGATRLIDRTELAAKGPPLQKERWSGTVDSVGGATLVNALAQTFYGGAVAACGLAGGADLPGTVLPFILRGVALLGVDSVMAPAAMRVAAWRRLARDLKPELLTAVARVEPMSQAKTLAEDILAGRIQGRVVIDVTK